MNTDMPLASLEAGESGLVVGCASGQKCLSRLAAMGFTPGARVTMISNYRHAPVLVLVHGSRVALGRGEATKVFVRPDGDGHGE
ncbi:MAG: FeoA family protein [Anaerolineae bacterium]